MSERLFIELANLHQITPEWVQQKQGFGFDRVPFEPHVRSIMLAQREIIVSLDRIMDDKKPGTFALRNLEALSDPFRFKTPYQLERELMISPVAIEAAKDFLHFYQTENHKRLHHCPWCRQYFIDRPNKKYCGPDCKDNYHNRRHSVSGYAREAMRKYRAKK